MSHLLSEMQIIIYLKKQPRTLRPRIRCGFFAKEHRETLAVSRKSSATHSPSLAFSSNELLIGHCNF